MNTRQMTKANRHCNFSNFGYRTKLNSKCAEHVVWRRTVFAGALQQEKRLPTAVVGLYHHDAKGLQHYIDHLKISHLVLFRCNSDASFQVLGYLNGAIISWAIWGRRGPLKIRHGCTNCYWCTNVTFSANIAARKLNCIKILD